MSDFLTSAPPMVIWAWLTSKISLPWSSDFRAFARVVDDEIIGVVAYEGFTGTACRMHMAGKLGWVSPKVVRTAFSYPFIELGLDMVFGLVPSGNTLALALDLRLGFEQLLYIPGAHPDGGLHFLQLSRDKWLGSKYGRKITGSTRSATSGSGLSGDRPNRARDREGAAAIRARPVHAKPAAAGTSAYRAGGRAGRAASQRAQRSNKVRAALPAA